MSLRIDSILNDSQLMSVINAVDGEQTITAILNSNKPVAVIDLHVSSDTLDIVLYLMFKELYERKVREMIQLTFAWFLKKRIVISIPMWKKASSVAIT